MISIGNKKQIFSISSMVKDNESASFEVPFGESKMPISFVFVPGEENERDASWESKEGSVKFTFKGSNNPLGTCTTEPTKFADLGNKKIYFHVAQYHIGNALNLVHFFIFLGAPNE